MFENRMVRTIFGPKSTKEHVRGEWGEKYNLKNFVIYALQQILLEEFQKAV
jgi:hypothetical protein